VRTASQLQCRDSLSAAAAHGARAAARGLKRVALFTDPMLLLDGPIVSLALDSLRGAGLETWVCCQISVSSQIMNPWIAVHVF